MTGDLIIKFRTLERNTKDASTQKRPCQDIACLSHRQHTEKANVFKTKDASGETKLDTLILDFLPLEM